MWVVFLLEFYFLRPECDANIGQNATVTSDIYSKSRVWDDFFLPFNSIYRKNPILTVKLAPKSDGHFYVSCPLINRLSQKVEFQEF
jgi:hypothetical protein